MTIPGLLRGAAPARGAPHHLARITEEEAALLRAYGGGLTRDGAVARDAEMAATGIRHAADAGWGAAPRRANDLETRYGTSDDPVHPPPRNRPALPEITNGPAEPGAAPPRATLDPEGRHLTAPRIFGRDGTGQVLAHSPEDVGSLLDDLAGGGVRRGVPAGEMGPRRRGDAHVSAELFGQGDTTRAQARVRIRRREPYGDSVEAHEAGHATHFIRDGESRLTPQARAELRPNHEETTP